MDSNLQAWIERGAKVFPWSMTIDKDGEKKTPLTEHGHLDASNDPAVIDGWAKRWPRANWGAVLPENIFAIDLDVKHGKNGIDTWKKLVDGKGENGKTLIEKTVSGGYHVYFQADGKIKRDVTGRKLGEGIDILGVGGWVAIPPSKGYSVQLDAPIAKAPKWLLILVSKPAIEIRKGAPTVKPEISRADIEDAVNRLDKARADDRDGWIQVGMILHTLGDDYLAMWDSWSKQSEKYVPGECAKKWLGFHDDGGLTVGTLFMWADEDSKGRFILPAPKRAKPSHYMGALHELGYTFTMNAMNDRVYCNGQMISGGLDALLKTNLRQYGYQNPQVAEDAYIAEAYEHQFHPIRDYLHRQKWDGKNHIEKLASYFEDEDGIFPLLIRKWLVGSVYKILKRPGQLNPMLGLDGKQGLGKSRFAWWLCSMMPMYYKVGPIYPDNKDHESDAVSYFVWEVEELGSTLRRADREALKAFISREKRDFRPPYGHFNISKPSTCSYIGTVNNESGFLSDPTGNRRFRVCTLTKIDWKYSTEVDINQVWAQAVELVKSGESSDLTEDELKIMSEVNSRYEVEDVLEFFLQDYFQINPALTSEFTPTGKIVQVVREHDYVRDSDLQLQRRIGSILTKAGCKNTTRWVGDKKYHGWAGVAPKSRI